MLSFLTMELAVHRTNSITKKLQLRSNARIYIGGFSLYISVQIEVIYSLLSVTIYES